VTLSEIHRLLLEYTNSARIFIVAEESSDSADATAFFILTLAGQEITG
jgi:hypothetical protein